ncbi:MAG: C10 family peptidase [Bacteroidaceae bacterium]|nr:C10 family peptidase [Bacteroidaceae bacterium]
MSDYNVNNVIRDLKVGNKIVVMSGFDHYRHVCFFGKKYYSGHAWVVDGYIDQIKNGVNTKYIHCNWGWNGNLDGYFQSDYLNADNGVRFDDNGNSYSYEANLGKQINYREKLKTATFTK